MTYQEREELNQLSLEVFGTSSRWKKLVEKGFQHKYNEKQKKIVPNMETRQLEEVEFDVPRNTLVRYTDETVKTLMLNILRDRQSKAEIDVSEVLNAVPAGV